MNNLKSYTEYAVNTPTTDFVIGFDFNYGTDAVNVLVDNVPATEAGYSVIYLNSTTMRLNPAVPSGVVRLQRETDIDVPDNQFTAGAKFIASNMDENFTQLRHAQQEVRDGFSKLSDDTYEIIDTLQVVGQAAQDAADAAEQAAQTANDAAAQVTDKVSYQDLDAAVELAVEPIRDYTALPFEVGKSYDLNARVVLENGTVVKNTVASNTTNPNENMTGWVELESAVSTKFSTLNNAINRVVADRFLERVSVKDFGAIGDGSLHTLQEWVDSGKFSGLPAIQVVIPFVTSLTQSIDWAATQYCLLNAKNIFIPQGKYVFSDVAKFPHNTTPFNVGTSAVAPRVFGDGVCTTITRNDERPATRIMNAEGTSTTQESDTSNMNEACFSIHCPYAQISDLTIESSRIGIYFGQDFAQPFTSLSSVSKSNINRVQINRCGTGVLMLAAGGNHYVDFSDMHFTSCQIDVNQRASFWWKITQGRGDANNNRNCFTRIRSGRSRVGYWNDCGDTNTLIEWHGEGINHTTANNPYPIPEGLPTGVPNGSCMFVFTGSNQLNKISYCNLEQVGYHVYNAGSNNTFSFNLINEAYVKNVNPPKEWFGRYVTRFRGYGYADNAYPDTFPELAVAGRVYFGLDATNGTAIVSNNKYHIPNASTRGSYDTQFQVETGAITANTAKAIQLWANIDASSCAMINVDIVGRCDTTGQISSFNTKVMVNAYRTTARALTRFGVSKISSSRATYEGTLDTVESNHIAVTLQKNATTPQILEAVLSCPFDLTSATVFVDMKVMK